MNKLIPKEEFITGKIYVIRCQKVIKDANLASLYNVETKVLIRAVRRNIERFPEDFMFELSQEEFNYLRFQIGTPNWGGTRYSPMVFTGQGVAVLSGIIGSPTAIRVNIQILRVFVKMCSLISGYQDLLKKIEALVAGAADQNHQIIRIYEIIKELIEPLYKNRNPLGYRLKEERGKYIIQNS